MKCINFDRAFERYMAEWIKECPQVDGEVVRTVENAYSPYGGLRVMHGNLAPDRGVVKQSAVSDDMRKHRGPARVFESEEEACEAIFGTHYLAYFFAKREPVPRRTIFPIGQPHGSCWSRALK